jgi:ATP-dependent DNA ligase
VQADTSAEAARGDKWQYEIKIDGYRTQLHLRSGKATVFTSSGLDWTDKFATISDAANRFQPTTPCSMAKSSFKTRKASPSSAP